MSTSTNQLMPAYDFDSNDSSTLLKQIPIKIRINGNSYDCTAKVKLDLFSNSNICLYFNLDVPLLDFLKVYTGDDLEIPLYINGHDIEGFLCVEEEKKIEPGVLNIKWYPIMEPIIGSGDKTTKIEQAIFHLFNFVNIPGNRCPTEQDDTTINTINYIDIETEEWKIEIRSLKITSKNIRYLGKIGGYKLTHIGCIRRSGGIQFTGEDLDECLDAIRFALSFVKGGWCEPICAVGYDALKERVWEKWNSPMEAWYNTFSWVDPRENSQLPLFFSCFMKMWSLDNWSRTLHKVIYWYLNANFSSRGIDAGIILTQAALECLSYQFLVEDRKCMTTKTFKKLWASEKFRLLFSSLRIPLDIPPETSNLQKLANIEQWDAPRILTEIRNSLVHPEHNKCEQSSSTYYEAWNLGLWYLEMGILAVCGYNGVYRNRLKQQRGEQIENVPWFS